jgi:SAM-dependent methyltransferase
MTSDRSQQADAPNADQRAFWSDDAGHKWVTQQQVMDTLLAPVLDRLLAHADLRAGDHVLDIGCGAGTSTMRAASLVGPKGHVTGADISDTLLSHARSRAGVADPITYLHADAATHAFAPNGFDHLISRFGVMFFDDATAAFQNLVKGLRKESYVTMATWGAIEANPYFKLAAKAARAVLGPMPKSDPDAPGPFAMRDPERIIPMLTDAGLSQVVAHRERLALTPPGTLQDFAGICAVIGPAEAAMRHFAADAGQQEAVHASLIETFRPFAQPDGTLRIPAEILFYTART